ncbi:hypothetical protein KDX08_30280 [Burkholderia cenocepacia]|uniref:hypothetical protein n=1 Tax=Burkholderia cenocepacia TaxID=95486 RepID=UPI001B957300|nr:hypothetical protein [Burkholderia cenocepacia]MBR7996743.1 hypothetical protein [Burkholderia cenocepacia]
MTTIDQIIAHMPKAAQARTSPENVADALEALALIEKEQPAQAAEAASIPEPTDDVLCSCGWETWNSLGSYIDRGAATARYRTIAAFVLASITSPQPQASQTRGAQ